MFHDVLMFWYQKNNSQGSVPTYDCSACVLSTGNEVMKGSNGDKTL